MIADKLTYTIDSFDLVFQKNCSNCSVLFVELRILNVLKQNSSSGEVQFQLI